MTAGEFDSAGFRLGRVTGDTHSWYARSATSSNARCPYCGAALVGQAAMPSNKEHLIARQFGPARAMTGNEFNLIFRSCIECNSLKADLERHVSSISLFNGPGRAVDPAAAEAAVRKAMKDFHPDMPGVRVADAHKELKMMFDPPGMSMSFGMTAPPQVYPPYAEQLAFMHVQGFYSFVTSRDYQSTTGLSTLEKKNFQIFGRFTYEDWGNPQLLEVVDRVRDWEPLVNVSTANGYFKAQLRMSNGQGWFWALEWNKWMRVVGGLCNEPMPLFAHLPPLRWLTTPTGRTRRQIRLEGEDALFPELTR